MRKLPTTAEEYLRVLCVKTQISFARNITGVPFPTRLRVRPGEQLVKHLVAELRKQVKAVEDLTESESLMVEGEVRYGLLPRSERSPLYRLLRLTSDTGLVVWCELMTANHLTFSMSGPGGDFRVQTEALRRFVDTLAGPLGFAYSERLGYLTAQLSLLGTGFRIRSWMHVGALDHFGTLRELCNAAQVKGELVEFDAYDPPPPGSLLILFNRFSMGARAEQLAERHYDFLERVAEQERRAQARLLYDEPFFFLSELMRVKVMLKQSMMLAEQETLDALSILRIAVMTGVATMARSAPNPLLPSVLDEVREGLFLLTHGAEMREDALPPAVKAFGPWREETLRASWMRRFAAFKMDNYFVERALHQ